MWAQERGQGTQGCGHSKASRSSSKKDAPRRTGWEKPGLCGFGPQPWAASPRCCSGPSAGGTSGAGRTTAALPMQALWHSSRASPALGALPASPGRKEGKSARESSHARTVGDGGAVTRLVGEAHTAGDALWWCQAGWFQLRVAPSSQRLLVLGINPGRGHTPLPSQRSWHPCHSARNPIWEQGGRRDTDTRTWVMRRRKVLEGAAAHPAPAPRHEGMVKGAGGNTSTDPLAGVRGTRSHWHGPAGPQLPLPSTTAGTRLCPWEHTVHSGMGVQSCPRADYQLTRWIVANRLWEWDNSCGHESSWIWSHHQSSELLPSSLHRSPGNQPPSLHSLESHSSSSKPRVGGTGCDSMG